LGASGSDFDFGHGDEIANECQSAGVMEAKRTKTMSGATPLAALEAVAVDTETTGLDTAKARVVQLAGVAIALGAPHAQQAFSTLVDPEIPIPAAATAIHGIGDETVRGAPRFAEALARFQEFRGERLLIGHSIGFDLAVIEHEARRAGIAWEKPRSLCVRLLGAIANPRLPEGSLEALAAWLGVAVSNRHTAPGDALAAAGIFVALAPRLAARGIHTLAQAERACLDLSDRLETGYRAGWSEPVTSPHPSETSLLDPYAYSHRVNDLMRRDIVVLNADATAQEAVDQMVNQDISSTFVSADGKPGDPLANYGIVTERDVMRLVAAHGAQALAMPLGSFASRPLASIAGGAFVYRAIGRMDRLKLRHLAVRDERERLAGVISARDLLRLRAGAAFRLDDAIDAASSAEEMAQAWATLPTAVRLLVAEDLDARLVAGVISEEIRIMTRRAAELAEAAMHKAGRGPPPCPYALMVLGSGGRGESLLAPDQDNAVVYASGEPDGPEDRWFAELGAHVADTLNAAGIPYCSGGVMARNAAWRGSFAVWKDRVQGWVGRARGDDLLNVDIFFDQRPVHGDLALGAELFDYAFAAGTENPGFAKLMGEKLFARPSPFGLFGGFQTVDGRLDLKLHGLFPIVAAARTAAIRHGIRRRSTRRRLGGLVERGLGNAGELAELAGAHRLFMAMMLEQQARDLETGIPVSNSVEIHALSRAQQAKLKSALKTVEIVPELIRALMFA
jgi:CBS domain-containing protein